MVTTRPPKTIVKPTALGPVANTDTKLLIYGLFQKGRVLAQDGGAQAKGEAHEGKAPDRQATVIFYKPDKNGRICDLVLPSDPHFSSEMLKSPDFLRRIRKTLLAAGHPVGEFGHPRPTA